MNRRTFLQTTAAAASGLILAPGLLPAGSGDPKYFTGRQVFDRLAKTAKAKKWKALPMGTLMTQIGLELLGTPYVGSTLEISDTQEKCSVNFVGLDCVTFFELALGMAAVIKKGDVTPSALMNHVTKTRYRGGKVTDYASRLHYTSDWMWDNQQKKTVKIITDTLPGAEKFTKTINFMSAHPDSYKQLKGNPDMIAKIQQVETQMNSRNLWWLAKDKIAQAEEKLQSGDIIGITTTVDGLDCSHTGMCYRDDQNVLRFLHASLSKKAVTLDVRLSQYLAGNSKQTGIMVVRPLDAAPR